MAYFYIFTGEDVDDVNDLKNSVSSHFWEEKKTSAKFY